MSVWGLLEKLFQRVRNSKRFAEGGMLWKGGRRLQAAEGFSLSDGEVVRRVRAACSARRMRGGDGAVVRLSLPSPGRCLRASPERDSDSPQTGPIEQWLGARALLCRGTGRVLRGSEQPGCVNPLPSPCEWTWCCWKQRPLTNAGRARLSLGETGQQQEAVPGSWQMYEESCDSSVNAGSERVLALRLW